MARHGNELLPGTSMNIEVPLTWIDVARRLAAATAVGCPPPPRVLRAKATWYGVDVEVEDGTPVSVVQEWLEKLFPSRFKSQPDRIELDGPMGNLEVSIEPMPRTVHKRVSFGIIDGVVDYVTGLPPQLERPVPVVACLSVKGGTGRTTSAVAFSHCWAQSAEAPILLVDADIEAPGISYMFESVAGRPKISLEDVVALAHSDESLGAEATIAFSAERLRDHLLSERIYVLPLRRDIDELASSSIRAEHLSTPDRPFALADILSRIGKEMGCAGVVVDVRAGLVPLGVNLALDPGVSSIIVTTLSNQSLRATGTLSSFISREVRRSGGSPRRPLLVINRVPGVFRQSGMDQQLIAPLVEEMVGALIDDGESEGGISDSLVELEPLSQLVMPELPDIQVMSGDWHHYVSQLMTSGFSTTAKPVFLSWISSELDGPDGQDTSAGSAFLLADASERQERLRAYAGRLIAAENVDSEVPRPLVTKPLASLARRFQSEVPIAISEGAKGTGKTMASRYFASRGNWRDIVSDLISVPQAVEALILPVTGSAQAAATVQGEIDDARKRVADVLGWGSEAKFPVSTAFLREQFSKDLSEGEWIKIWLDVIAWSAGYKPTQRDVGDQFLESLRNSNQKVLALVEGLEELYSSVHDVGVSAALRAALISLPQRLRSEPGRPLGVLVFARRDTVEAAVTQNLDQFRREYASFALSWSEGDVLELAAWLATKSNAIPELWSDNFSALDDGEKKRRLEALWGRKLGPEDKPGKRTREAYTATWVIAVLSDLRGRLVPRDLVRLLATAAATVATQEERRSFPNRLLIPRSIRSAIEPTSEQKVLETKEEISELGPILSKFEQKPDEVVAPLTQDSLHKLGVSDEDVRLLVKHGIVFGERAPYEVPELFRRGLGLKHVGARRSVVNLYMRARQRYAAGS